MDVGELLERASDDLNVKRVYGEPVERDGVTVIPVARVLGGGGGGSGTKGEESGSGGGFGGWAKPVGVYVIRDGKVSWQPALDINRIILGGQLAVITLFLVVRSVAHRRSGRKR
jgi:uncharacterized spore protein YtfJ